MNIPARTARQEQVVTASRLVREFGVWQERAVRAPVYVLHRGRPRLVLTSVDIMDALCAPHMLGDDQPSSGPSALLDLIGDVLLTTDREGYVTAASRGAREQFGAAAAPGEPLDRIAGEAARPVLTATLQRVAATGVADQIDIPSARRRDRRFAAEITPYGDGLLVHARDLTLAAELRQAAAEEATLRAAIAAVQDSAVARINLRGHVEAPDEAFARLIGLPAGALDGVRFVSLVETSARPQVGEAIERAIGDGATVAVTAQLLLNRGDPRTVRIGLAPRRTGLAITGVTAMIVPAPAVAS